MQYCHGGTRRAIKSRLCLINPHWNQLGFRLQSDSLFSPYQSHKPFPLSKMSLYRNAVAAVSIQGYTTNAKPFLLDKKTHWNHQNDSLFSPYQSHETVPLSTRCPFTGMLLPQSASRFLQMRCLSCSTAS